MDDNENYMQFCGMLIELMAQANVSDSDDSPDRHEWQDTDDCLQRPGHVYYHLVNALTCVAGSAFVENLAETGEPDWELASRFRK